MFTEMSHPLYVNLTHYVQIKPSNPFQKYVNVMNVTAVSQQ